MPVDHVGRRFVVVIGIDNYPLWTKLHNAVSDAKAARATFVQLGYEEPVKPLLNEEATGEALQRLIHDDLTALGPDDSLVLFFAGHGGKRVRQVGGRELKTGYLIPADATKKYASWIELDPWLRNISALPAKHILVILDACHSGIVLSPSIQLGRGDGLSPRLPFEELQSRMSRQIIASALDDQLAMDKGPLEGHSLFTGYLIKALEGEMKPAFVTRGLPLATASEIGAYLRKHVSSYPESQQTPDYGCFHFDQRGEMLIPLRQPTPVSDARRSGMFGSLHVLVVDDDAWILRMVSTVLEKRGYTVETASDGEDALMRMLARTPDLLITDVILPKLDGWALVQRIRSDSNLATVPVIFLTALMSEDDRIRGFRLGADDYITKPFRFEEFDLRVAKTLRPRALKTRESHHESVGSAGLRGDLSQIKLSLLLRILEEGRQTGLLQLCASDESTAQILVRDGSVVHARLDEADEPVDAECIYYLLTWGAGQFEFVRCIVEGTDRVNTPTAELLAEGARLLDESREPATAGDTD